MLGLSTVTPEASMSLKKLTLKNYDNEMKEQVSWGGGTSLPRFSLPTSWEIVVAASSHADRMSRSVFRITIPIEWSRSLRKLVRNESELAVAAPYT